MGDVLRLDAVATTLISHDVVMLGEDVMALPTPCEGWTVADLVQHVNEQHEDVTQQLLGPFDHDPAEGARGDFALISARWLVALDGAGAEVHVPKVGGVVPTDRVLSVHLVDMLVHRWDLAQALGTPSTAPAELAAAALPVAEAITEPGSPLVGAGGVYGSRVAVDDHRSPLDRIVGLVGRDPDWRTTQGLAPAGPHDRPQ